MMHHQIHLTTHPEVYDRRRCLHGTRAYWVCQAIGWVGLLLLIISPLPFRMHVGFAEFIAVLAYVITGVGMTHLTRLGLIYLLQKPVLWFLLLARSFGLVLITSVIHALIQVTLVRSILPNGGKFLSSQPSQDPFSFVFVDTFSLSFGLYIAWTGFYIGTRAYHHYHESRVARIQLAADIQEAAWKALRAQLNPHLLFNSLNSIRALIPRDCTQPREAITHLAELLRTSLSIKEHEVIPLRREMETVDSYLALELLRFEKRLRVVRDLDPSSMDWPVPPFLIQILVENAVKYGVAPFPSGGDVLLSAHVIDHTLVVEVVNRGQVGVNRASTSTNLGLVNLRSRLALLFGPSATVTLENVSADSVRARATVPQTPTHYSLQPT